MQVPTIRVKPWGSDQGDHVVINEADFDPSVHQKLDDDSPAPAPAKRAPAKRKKA